MGSPLIVYKDGWCHCVGRNDLDVTHWFANTPSEALGTGIMVSAILNFWPVLTPEDSMLGCVGGTRSAH